MSAQAKCCVCGEPSEQRCGGCKGSFLDLFFCSKAHQKLVWFAHKPVCGLAKAKPIRFPALSADDTALYLASEPLQQALDNKLFEKLAEEAPKTRLSILKDLQDATKHRPVPVKKPHAPAYKGPSPHGEEVVLCHAGFTCKADASEHDGDRWLKLPAYTFALDLYLWLLEHKASVPEKKIDELLHRATIWAGLLRLLSGDEEDLDRAVSATQVVGRLRDLLEDLQAYLILGDDPVNDGLLPLLQRNFDCVPSMKGYGVHYTFPFGQKLRLPPTFIVTLPDEAPPWDRMEPLVTALGIPVSGADWT